MKQRIWKVKLIYDEQVEMGWTGLETECKDVCKKVGLKNVHGMVTAIAAIEKIYNSS